MWMLPGRIPFSYVFGILAVFLLTLVLVSVGQAATSIIRLSRAGLPQQYVRSAVLRAILFFAALLLLIAAFIIYGLSDYARSREHGAQSSNQAMERTATRCAFTFRVAWTSSLRPTRAPGGRRSSFSR
jgi:hypothetical protein